MNENNTEIVLIPSGNTPSQIDTSIGALNRPLASLLEHIGLPTENILSPVEERRTVHFEYNNFYNEYPHAKSIQQSIPKTGIPKAVKTLFVKVICMCYCGNGKGYKNGVDERALYYYEKFIDMFTIEEIKVFLQLFNDNEFVLHLDMPKAEQRMRELAKQLRSKTTDVLVKKALYIISAFAGKSLHKIASDSSYKEAIKHI